MADRALSLGDRSNGKSVKTFARRAATRAIQCDYRIMSDVTVSVLYSGLYCQQINVFI